MWSCAHLTWSTTILFQRLSKCRQDIVGSCDPVLFYILLLWSTTILCLGFSKCTYDHVIMCSSTMIYYCYIRCHEPAGICRFDPTGTKRSMWAQKNKQRQKKWSAEQRVLGQPKLCASILMARCSASFREFKTSRTFSWFASLPSSCWKSSSCSTSEFIFHNNIHTIIMIDSYW